MSMAFLSAGHSTYSTRPAPATSRSSAVSALWLIGSCRVRCPLASHTPCARLPASRARRSGARPPSIDSGRAGGGRRKRQWRKSGGGGGGGGGGKSGGGGWGVLAAAAGGGGGLGG